MVVMEIAAAGIVPVAMGMAQWRMTMQMAVLLAQQQGDTTHHQR